jgi:uncharacterized protein YqgC (DUF456 family)
VSEWSPIGYSEGMTILLWLLAVVLVITGLVMLVQGSIIAGIAVMILGFLVGPGGVSLFSRRHAA